MVLQGGPRQVRNLLSANVASTPPDAKIQESPRGFLLRQAGGRAFPTPR
jgi:hypothetical protein